MFYVKDIPYLKALPKTIFLPKGVPMGKGNLAFIYSNSVAESIKIINEPKTFANANKYRWYFYNLVYRGKIGTKMYRKKDQKERMRIYKEISDNTTLRPYGASLIIRSNEERNTYFDLVTYNNIFNEYSANLQPMRLIDAYWNYYKPIYMDTYGKLTYKCVIINANNYKNFKNGKLRDKLNNPLFLLYYTLMNRMDLISDLDIDFLVYCNGRVMKVNPSKCDEKSYIIYLRELKKLYNVQTIPIENKEDIEELNGEVKEPEEEEVPIQPVPSSIIKQVSPKKLTEIKPKNIIIKNVKSSFISLSKNFSDDVKSKIEAKIEKSVSAKMGLVDDNQIKDETTKKIVEDSVKKEVEKEIDNDETLIKEIYNQMQRDSVPEKSLKSSARDQQLREKQKDINVKGTTIKELERKKDVAIEETDVSSNIKSTNENVKHIKFNNFNKTYNEKLLNKDIMDCFTMLNEKSIKMFIRDVKVEDTSNELNYKETWTVQLEDENRKRHTIKVDIPKFLEDRFLWLGGNRKCIKNQNFFLPLVKINEDTVLIVSNYNKLTIKRIDTKSLRGINILERLIVLSDKVKTHFKTGNAFFENKEYVTTIEYDELAKRFREYHGKGVVLYFSQVEATTVMNKKMIKPKNGKIFIGMHGNTPIFIDEDTQTDENGKSIVDIIVESLEPDEQEKIKEVKVPKRLMYTNITTMEQNCPLVIILCLWEGLSTVLKKAGIKYRLASTIRDKKLNEDSIRFKNCYLIYEDSIPNQLLLNGMKLLKTELQDISAFDTRDGYAEFITKKFGRVTAMNMLMNAYEFMLGSIEVELLKDMNLPTDIVSLCIHANHILCDSQHEYELSLNHSRIRCNEIIPSILYDKIAKAYTPFKNSNGKKKLSIPQDAVIKELLKQKTVEDYDSLNPLLELETNHAVSTKGFRGINLEQSYTVPKRCYDPTMIGVIGPSSSPDGNVGVSRTLTMEPNIRTARGYIDVKNDKLDEVKDVNLFSPAELLIPLGVTRDDAIRTGHSVKQSRHVIPVQKSSPVLISNGSDEMCKYYLSSDFVVNAKQSGKVVEYDEKTKIMIVEYKDGTHQAINLDKRLVKNGGGGFELSNTLVTDLKVGDHFKANDTLAWHKNFFTKDKYQGTRLCVGTLAKVAICSSYNTYEDGTFVTQKFSEEATTEMCFKKSVVLGRHSNVSQIVKVGDTINTGEPLVQFDDSFDEADINVLLDSLGDNENLKDSVISNSRNVVKSKYSGVIEEIKMYSTADLDELSPSLKKIFTSYYNKIKEKKAVLKKYNEEDGIVYSGLMMNETTGKIEPNKYGVIRGEKVNDGVLIEFYIKHAEPLEVGSKIANFTALKNVIGEVLEKGYEPYSEFRQDEEIATFIAANSILARMTPSVLLNAFGNKCIIELKRSLKDIWDHTKDLATRRKNMESLIYKFFTAIDKSGVNTKHYKDIFEPMSDNAFNSYFRDFFANDDKYLILTIVDYERTIKIPDIEKAAKVLNIPLYEYVYMPHINHDKERPVVTIRPVPVGYINIKRTQQTIAKKNGLSTNIDARSAITGQVVQHDKNGRESDLENIMLTSLGLTNTLKELNGPRADDLVMKQQMNQSINTKGYVSLSDLDDRIENKTTLNTVDTYFLGMGLKTDLVTKGLKTISTIRKE